MAEWFDCPHCDVEWHNADECRNPLCARINELETVTDEDVERAAMAIAHEASPYRWTQLNNADKGWFRDMARAALSAYLEGPEWKWTEEELDEMQDLTEAE